MMLEHQDKGGGLGEECDGMKILKGGLGVPASGWWVERPSGTPDHHRGLYKHRIRGCGPLLLLLS
jgi:hypothetical protein